MRNKNTLTLLAALTTCTLALSGCGSTQNSEPVPPNSNPVAGEAPAGILKGHTLTYAGDGGTTQQAQLDAFFTPFAKQTGVNFKQDSPQTLAKIQTQVESGNIQWDFISSWADAIERECGTLFEKLDTSKIDTSQIPEKLLSKTECGIPSIVYATVLAYNEDKIDGKTPQNWEDFFNLKQYPGKRALYSGDGKIDGSTVQAAALAAGWNPQTEPWTTAWAEAGLDKIDSIKDELIFYSTGAQSQQMLESGEVAMAGVWNGRALAATKNGANVKVAWQQFVALIDYFAIVKGTPNLEAAYYAINYTLGKQQQEQWAEKSGYSPTNTEAKPGLDKQTSEYILTTPERQQQAVDVQLDFWSDTETVEPLQNRWAALVAGA